CRSLSRPNLLTQASQGILPKRAKKSITSLGSPACLPAFPPFSELSSSREPGLSPRAIVHQESCGARLTVPDNLSGCSTHSQTKDRKQTDQVPDFLPIPYSAPTPPTISRNAPA